MSTRLRSHTKLVEGNQQAVLTVAGLLVAEGATVEPVFILRASDPAAAKAVVIYINEAIDRDGEPFVIEHAKQALQEFQRWAKEYGTFRQLEAPYHKDYVGDSALPKALGEDLDAVKAHVDKGTPLPPAFSKPKQLTPAKKPGKRK